MSDRLYLLQRHGVITKFVARQPIQLTESDLLDQFPDIPDDCDDIVAWLNENKPAALTEFFDQLAEDGYLDTVEDPKGKAYEQWDKVATIMEDDGNAWRYCFDPVPIDALIDEQ